MVTHNHLTAPEKPNLYVGCALTDAPQEFIHEVASLKTALGSSWHVLQFLGLTDGTAADVYQQDIATNVRGCDAFVGVADYGATGLGWELGVADERQIPTLIVASAASKVTRLVVGAPAHRTHITFRRYTEMLEEVPHIVNQEFAHILARSAGSQGKS